VVDRASCRLLRLGHPFLSTAEVCNGPKGKGRYSKRLYIDRTKLSLVGTCRASRVRLPWTCLDVKDGSACCSCHADRRAAHSDAMDSGRQTKHNTYDSSTGPSNFLFTSLSSISCVRSRRPIISIFRLLLLEHKSLAGVESGDSATHKPNNCIDFFGCSFCRRLVSCVDESRKLAAVYCRSIRAQFARLSMMRHKPRSPRMANLSRSQHNSSRC